MESYKDLKLILIIIVVQLTIQNNLFSQNYFIEGNTNPQSTNPWLGEYTGTSDFYSSYHGKTYPHHSCYVRIRPAQNGTINVFVKTDMNNTLKSTVVASGKYSYDSFNISTRSGTYRHVISARLSGNNIIGKAVRYLVELSGKETVSYSIKFNCERR